MTIPNSNLPQSKRRNLRAIMNSRTLERAGGVACIFIFASLVGAAAVGAGEARAEAPSAPAAARPAAARTPAPQSPYGPPIAGLCVFSRDDALAASRAAGSVNSQLQLLRQGAQIEMDGESRAIASEAAALSAQNGGLTEPVRQQRAVALQARAQAHDQAVQQWNATLGGGSDAALRQIAVAIDPIANKVVAARHCSVLVDRRGLYGANPSMDITNGVLERLNAQMPSVAVVLARPAATAAGR